MGRKRKVENVSTIAKKVNTSRASPQIAGEEKMHSPTDQDASAKQDSTPTRVVVRRSLRVRNSASLIAGSKEVKHVPEHGNVVESEIKEATKSHQGGSPLPNVTEKILEQEAPQTQQLNTSLAVNDNNVEEKVDCIVQAVDEFKYPVPETQNEHPIADDLSYPRLYIESQKKIDELMENNFELVRKLDFAHGKIEAYEKMMGALVSNPGKPTEATSSLSPSKVQKSMRKKNSKTAADATEGHNA